MSDETDIVRHGASGLGGAGLMVAVQMLWSRINKAEESDVKSKLAALERGQQEILQRLAVLADRERRTDDDRRELSTLKNDREAMSVRLATMEARIESLVIPRVRESRPT